MIVEEIDAVGTDRISWRFCMKVCRDLLPCASWSIPIVAQVDSSRSSATFRVTTIAIRPSISTRRWIAGRADSMTRRASAQHGRRLWYHGSAPSRLFSYAHKDPRSGVANPGIIGHYAVVTGGAVSIEYIDITAPCGR